MKNRNYILSAAAAGMLILILDSRTAFLSALSGIELCIRTLIPSLFPFFILSSLITGALAGQPLPFLHPLEHLCRIPKGSGALLVIGLLGGYPVGAQNIAAAHRRGELEDSDARRMIAFCNNAGPAFLFGMVGQFFDHPMYSWLLWGIHIVSALIVSLLVPGKASACRLLKKGKTVTLSESVEKSVKVMGNVCAWVVFFRIVIGFLDRWILWLVPADVQVLIKGFLELSNGCVLLGEITFPGQRFILSSMLLGFGGFCVAMQTQSVSGGLSSSLYLPGKILHGCISFFLSVLVQGFFPTEIRFLPSFVSVFAVFILFIFTVLWVRREKITVAFPALLMYNQEKVR